MKNFTFSILFSLVALLATAQNPVFDWKQDTLSDGNILQKMVINEDHAAIAGNANTFFTSSNGGETWNSLNLMKPYYNLTGISIKNDVGYVITSREALYNAAQDPLVDGVLLKTTDGGNTWSVIDTVVLGPVEEPSLSPNAKICFGLDYSALETINDTLAYCAARWYEYNPEKKVSHSGVFKSSDGGVTWKNISGDLGSTTMSCIVFNGETGFTGGNKKLCKISTAADSLVDVFPQLPGDGSAYIFDIDFPSESELLIATTGDSVFTSNDLGESFTKFENIKGASDILKVNDSTIVLTSSKYLYISTDNGSNWNSTLLPSSLWEIGGVANDSLFLLAKAAIYKFAVSDVASGNYIYTTQNLGDGNLMKTHINGDKIIIVGNDLNFFESDDTGVSWNALTMPEIPSLNEILSEIDFYGLSAVGDEAYACVNRHYLVNYSSDSDENDIYWSGGVFYTDDNWETYKSVDIKKLGDTYEDDPSANPYHESCNGVNTSVIHYIGNDVVLLWTRWFDYTTSPKSEHSRVFKSVDAGKNWTPITDDLGDKCVKEIQSKGDTIYIVGNETFLASYTAGVDSIENTTEFTNLYPNLDKDEDDEMYLYTITLGSDNELFITTSKDSCWVSNDGGETFKTIGNLQGANDFYKFDNNSYMLMGTKGSIFTNDGGVNWLNCDPGKYIFEIGGVYNNKFYALAKSYFFTNDVNNFDLTTGITTTLTYAELNVQYKTNTIDLISTDGEIERCALYSISGKLVSLTEPNSTICKFNNNEFQPGIYIVHSLVKEKQYINKIVFR